jgi:hypothetical protein
VRRSSYHVSDGSRATGTTHTRLLRRLPHTLLIIQHTIFPLRIRSFALGVWVSIREHTSGYHYRTYWELTALVSGLHRNGWSGAAGCTGGRVTSSLPQYLPFQMRCVTQHHRISSDPVKEQLMATHTAPHPGQPTEASSAAGVGVAVAGMERPTVGCAITPRPHIRGRGLGVVA